MNLMPSNDNAEQARFLSVCSGIEAASVAFGPLGWQAVAFSEIEKFPSAVLAHHYPDVPNLGDFTAIDTKALGRVDILCGGTPCQAFSFAGLRGSLSDARGNLTLAFVELAHELAAGNGLRNAIWENVPGVLTTDDNAFGCFLAGLVGSDVPVYPPRGRKGFPDAGAVSGPAGRAAWRVLDAQYFGLAQRRERVVVVADFGNGADPAAVLFERQGVFRNSPPRRQAGQGVAGAIAASVGGSDENDAKDGRLIVHAIQGNVIGRHDLAGPAGARHQPDLSFTLTKTDVHAVAYAPEIARCDATREGTSQDYETTTMVVSVTGQISHALKAEGSDGSEDGTGRGTPIVAIPIDMRQASRGETMTNNRTAGSTGGAPGTGIGNDGDDPSPTIGTSRQPAVFTETVGAMVSNGDAHSGFRKGDRHEPVALTVAIRGRDGGATAEMGGDIATALRASPGGGDKPHVLTSAVRRLTPRECERLMGFPDDYTRISWRHKPADQCPDGPRYKALGNSWAVPQFAWVGRRLDAALATNENTRNMVAA